MRAISEQQLSAALMDILAAPTGDRAGMTASHIHTIRTVLQPALPHLIAATSSTDRVSVRMSPSEAVLIGIVTARAALSSPSREDRVPVGKVVGHDSLLRRVEADLSNPDGESVRMANELLDRLGFPKSQ